MISGPLGRFALGQVPHKVAVTPPPSGGGDLYVGGSEWDERFLRRQWPQDEVTDDEEGIILSLFYARMNRML